MPESFTALYAYSLLPVLSVASLLFFTLLFGGVERARGLMWFCGALVAWSGALLCLYFEPLVIVGQRLAACGAFVVATYLHVAYDFTGRKLDALVGFAYTTAAGLTLLGIVRPGTLYDPYSLTEGPIFWHGMALAVVASLVPLGVLALSARRTEGAERRRLLTLLLAGLVCYLGAWWNALLLTSGRVLPYGLFMVLAALLLIAGVVSSVQRASERRILNRSLSYSALTALISAGALFGVLSWVTEQAEPLVREYRASAFFLMFGVAVAIEPVRIRLQEWLGARLLKDRAPATALAEQLIVQEVRTDQVERLAELGAFTSAIAHEVRNPIGVLRAHLRVLELQGAPQETLDAMREQIDRASRFIDDLVHYGRPRPLEPREVDLSATLALAISSALQGRDGLEPVTLHEPQGAAPLLEADQGQLLQVFIILFDNAILALQGHPTPEVFTSVETTPEGALVRIEDTGPGIAPELLETLFEPFVTGRKREGALSGTGLGLAIAHRVVTRHGGRIEAGASPDHGGACFEISLPTRALLPTPSKETP